MKIFISYRRDDSAGYAGRLFDYLSAHFGARNVFMDIDTIEPGEDFRKVVSNAVGTCDVVLVMIGKQWLSILDSEGRRRLDDPRDWVQMEISAALNNPRVRVIPVLVRDAAMPGEHELPEGLKELTWRNAIELSDGRFQYDVRKLIGVIERIAAPDEGVPAPRRAIPPRRNSMLLWGGIAGLAVIVVLIWMFRSISSTAAPETPTLGMMLSPTEALAPSSTPAPLTEATSPPTAESTAAFVEITMVEEIYPTNFEGTSIAATQTQAGMVDYLVRLIDDYYSCVNAATHDQFQDYERCWNMLSDRPGEFQDNLKLNSGGEKAFIDYWNKYKVTYALYYCYNQGEQVVQAEYYHHPWDDLARTVGGRNLIEYHFALGPDGWRIVSGLLIPEISSFCEGQPRVDKRSLFP